MTLRALSLLLALALAGPAAAQDEAECLALNDQTRFCGGYLGWHPLPEQPVPGMVTFRNEDYTFTLSHQSGHGKAVNGVLYDTTIRSLLREVDRRHDQPEGSTRAAMDVDVEKDGVRGRRIGVLSQLDDVPVIFFMDIYYTAQDGWIGQTTQVGSTDMERLVKVHDFVIREVRFDR